MRASWRQSQDVQCAVAYIMAFFCSRGHLGLAAVGEEVLAGHEGDGGVDLGGGLPGHGGEGLAGEGALRHQRLQQGADELAQRLQPPPPAPSPHPLRLPAPGRAAHAQRPPSAAPPPGRSKGQRSHISRIVKQADTICFW